MAPDSTPEWQTLGSVAGPRLIAARDQAHQAAQLIAAAGETHGEAAPDTSHTAMVWSREPRLFIGRPLRSGLRLGLRIESLELLVLGESGVVASEALEGKRLGHAYEWTASALAEASNGAHQGLLRHPGFELPPHPLSTGGATFEKDAPALAELATWYQNASLELAARHANEPTTEPLCWPHHFDLAALIELETDATGAATKTVGLGLSPGDETIPEPYWYVNHWPGQPEAPPPPTLGAGEWHTEGWSGGILRAAELTAPTEAPSQQARLHAFLEDAIAANRERA